jgi:hypothetical protein
MLTQINQKRQTKMSEKIDQNKKRDNLDVTLQTKKENGVLITVSTKCATWTLMQKFLNDFENTLLKGNNDKK